MTVLSLRRRCSPVAAERASLTMDSKVVYTWLIGKFYPFRELTFLITFHIALNKLETLRVK